jgi:hypothetical protein
VHDCCMMHSYYVHLLFVMWQDVEPLPLGPVPVPVPVPAPVPVPVQVPVPVPVPVHVLAAPAEPRTAQCPPAVQMSWSGVDLDNMTRNAIDIDFYKLRLMVTEDCPYLLSLPLVVLCHSWMKIPDAMVGYLQIATSPVLYIPLVRGLDCARSSSCSPQPQAEHSLCWVQYGRASDGAAAWAQVNSEVWT